MYRVIHQLNNVISNNVIQGNEEKKREVWCFSGYGNA